MEGDLRRCFNSGKNYRKTFHVIFAMSHTKELWLTFAAGVAIVFAAQTVESAIRYPKLPEHLKDTCVTGNWHPECHSARLIKKD